jgi:hypothetical protein
MALSNMNIRTAPANAGGFTVGYDWNTVATDSTTYRITLAGKVAVVAALNSYYAGLATGPRGQLDDNYADPIGRGSFLHISAQGVIANCAPGDGPTVADQIATALNTAGNTAAV